MEKEANEIAPKGLRKLAGGGRSAATPGTVIVYLAKLLETYDGTMYRVET
jgi:hypothetical protein